MSNVTVQEALKNALFTIRCYRTEITLDKKRPNDLIEVDLVISEIEAALAEIEKCEPVAWKWKAKQLDGKILNRVELWNPISQYPEANSENVFDVRELYDKPQPRDWVGLSDSEWVNIVNHDHAYDSFTKDDAVHYAVKATEAKLKQLNTKG